MSRGICHRCWREGELLEVWPISRICFQKLDDGELVANNSNNQDSFRYPTYPKNIKHIQYPQEQVTLKRVILREGCEPHVIINFIPIHLHYNIVTSLKWAEGKIDELDLAINIMTLACPPTEEYRRGTGECKIPHVKLTGGSIVSKDIWNLHHFFRAEFIQNIPYEGGSINLKEVKNWIERKTKPKEIIFPDPGNSWGKVITYA